jgi:integrase
MKAGVEHRVPLSPRVLEILREAKTVADGGSFVFPGRRPSVPLSNMVFLMMLRRMGYTGITAHGFRSTFRDWTEEKTHTPRGESGEDG